ncbi:hypothetical protein RUM43_000814 [Polyplax serrata]|uniref:Protein ECT2 n=1 Tax=Polyplax serrata TaxID=468196 RepID=A0AAN8XSV3_POLSC
MGDEDMTELDTSMDENKRLCIVGSLGQDPSILQAAETFKVPVVISETGQEFVTDDSYTTYFVLKEFQGPGYDYLCQMKCRILGSTALQELVNSNEPLPPSDRIRPMYCLSMKGLIICFTGFRKRTDLCHLAGLIHLMGGSIRKEMEYKITHLVANYPSGDKYQYASTFNIPVMAESWVTTAWENRHVVGYSCKNSSVIAEHKLKFGGARVCFHGFTPEETEHMTQVLLSNRGVLSSLEDPQCTHLVLDGERTYGLVREKIFQIINNRERLKNCHYEPIRSLSPAEESAPEFNAPPDKEDHKKQFFFNFILFHLNKCRKILQFSIQPEFGSYFYDNFLESDEESSSVKAKKPKSCVVDNYDVVVDDANIVTLPESTPPKALIVKAEWFWASVQNELCADEKEYRFEDFVSSMITTPEGRRFQSTPLSGNASSRARKRKRLQHKTNINQFDSPLTHKRRSSISDAGLLSISGSYLDCTVTPDKDLFDDIKNSRESVGSISARHQVFLELVHTESNYVNILNTIIVLFKNPLEEMLEGENMILNATEVKIIFGNLPPIYEIHSNMLEELKWGVQNWKEDFNTPELEKAYPPFINYFEKSKETLEQCDLMKPRFHAFLKIRQTKPECGRQSLKELLIRPVQRLPSISLLLNDLIKQTDKQNPDLQALEQALAGIKQAMTHINEDKRKTEAQLAMFDLFNEIDNCPPHLISSHRSLVAKCECVELTEILSSKKGDCLVLLLFTDTLEVCKKRARTFNTFRSTKPSSLQKVNKFRKQYKHIRLMPLSNLRKVIDVRESEECQRVFSLLCRNSQPQKENLCSFVITDDKLDKRNFLREMCKQMAHTVCTTDPEEFYEVMEPSELNVDTVNNVSTVSRSTHSFSKALRFASKTGVKVGRALSMNKTPNKLTRAVSTLRPFASQATLTPTSSYMDQSLMSRTRNILQ